MECQSLIRVENYLGDHCCGVLLGSHECFFEVTIPELTIILVYRMFRHRTHGLEQIRRTCGRGRTRYRLHISSCILSASSQQLSKKKTGVKSLVVEVDMHQKCLFNWVFLIMVTAFQPDLRLDRFHASGLSHIARPRVLDQREEPPRA